ncbi:hypothetical protein [Deinococcus multiflagellatus]|uniref:Uncharacterized protein n=1 Tax=Deinococcus multiflagellatus TaxID=1656887 RepID=A0ABW1ZUB4_9DEIO|nr:hypothetical protein [Deinococcus multiflagellatus]MBZ9714486.1 hypothetical protein [Deinococcus multiflagellatus]
MTGLRTAQFRIRRQQMAGNRLVGRAQLIDLAIFDYGNGTLELDDGSTFRVVDGRYIDNGDALVPGAGFVYGRDDEYTGTVVAQLTPWTSADT